MSALVGAVVMALVASFPTRNALDRQHERRSAHEPEPERDRDRSEGIPNEGPFWDWRVSYPTGHFEASWYDKALPQHERLAKGIPVPSRVSAAASAGTGLLDPTSVTALGPSPQDSSPFDMYGMVAGRINTILTHPTQPNIAWFGSDGGGIWKTTNCCGTDTTWQIKTDSPQIANISIGPLVMDPRNPNVLYAGTGDFQRNRSFAFGASGLLKSTDDGDSWNAIATDVFNPVYSEPVGKYPQRRAVSAIAVDPLVSANIAVGTNQGLYFSNDAGATWQGPCFTNNFTSQRQDVTSLLAVTDGSTTSVLVAIGALPYPYSPYVRYDLSLNGANGIYRAILPTNGCPTAWTILSRPDNGWPVGTASGLPYRDGGNQLGRIDIAIAPTNNQVMYAEVQDLGMWRSTDGGSTWSQSATQPASFASGCQNDAYNNGTLFQDYNAGVIVSPTDPSTVFVSFSDLWRSTDGGQTFVDLTCGYDVLPSGLRGNVHSDHHARAFVAGGGGEQLLVGTDGGVYASGNALDTTPTFAAINGGSNTTEFYSGDLTPGFNDPEVLTRAILGSSQDNGTSLKIWGAGTRPAIGMWQTVDGADGTFAKIEPILQQRWYYCSDYGYIRASVTGPYGPSDQIVVPQDPNTYRTWSGDRLGFLSPFDLYKFGDATTCPAATGCQRIIAGTYRVWESISGGLPSSSWYINSPDLTKTLSTRNDQSIINKVVFSYRDPSIVVVGTNDGNAWMGFHLGQGSANSATWIDVTGSNAVLPNRPIMDVTTDPARSTTVYAALAGFDQNTPSAPGHVYQLTCNADCSSFAWANKSGDLPNIPVNAILINPHLRHQAFAGTDWGLYFTDDITAASPHWNRFDAGLPSAMIWGLVVDRGFTTLGIYTRSRGAYVWPLPGTEEIFADGFE